MAIKLSNKPNVEAPSPTYPFGSIKDNSGSNDGTPVDRQVYSDMHQFFESLMASGGIIHNGLPDNGVNGFQFLDALIKVIRGTYATETESGTLEIATQAETNTGTDDGKIVTPKKLKDKLDAVFGAWQLRSDISDVTIGGGTGVVTSSNIKYKIVGKVMHIIVSFTINTPSANVFFDVTLPNSKVSNVGFDVQDAVAIFDGSQQKLGRYLISHGIGVMRVSLALGETFGSSSAGVYFTTTIEIA